MTQTEPFVVPYSSVRVRLSDGTILEGADGLQVWMARRYERGIAMTAEDLLAGYRTWLERRGCYALATVATWTRIAQRLVEACPDGAYPATPEDAADLLAPAACMPHTRYNLRTGLRRFYEFRGDA